jgi:hypothetical protein
VLMGRLGRRICASAAALAVLLPSCASAAGLPGLLTNTGGRPFVVRPAQVIYTGDGSGVLGGFTGKGPLRRFGALRWSSWGRHQALGSGAVWLDDCIPNCAKGTFHPYAVRVHAFAPSAGHFTRLTLRYTFEGREVVDRRRLVKVGRSYTYG